MVIKNKKQYKEACKRFDHIIEGTFMAGPHFKDFLISLHLELKEYEDRMKSPKRRMIDDIENWDYIKGFKFPDFPICNCSTEMKCPKHKEDQIHDPSMSGPPTDLHSHYPDGSIWQDMSSYKKEDDLSDFYVKLDKWKYLGRFKGFLEAMGNPANDN